MIDPKQLEQAKAWWASWECQKLASPMARHYVVRCRWGQEILDAIQKPIFRKLDVDYTDKGT